MPSYARDGIRATISRGEQTPDYDAELANRWERARRENDNRHHSQQQQQQQQPVMRNTSFSQWDSQGTFPIMEIERMKTKTRKLRGETDDVSNMFQEESVRSFPTVSPSEASASASGMSGMDGQSVRRRKAPPPPPPSTGGKHLYPNRVWTADVSKEDSSTSWTRETSSVGDVLDRTESTSTKGTTSMTSDNARQAQQRMMRAFHSRGPPRSAKDESLDVSDPVTEASTVDESSSLNLALHDLCGEASSTDDIAWRNALHLLSLQPQLAQISDQGWTPLHICCLGFCPPPTFIVRALLYCHSAAAQQPDEGGRLPLHLVAASSGDVTIMHILVEEYPQALYQTDEHGLTPLHLLLRNLSVELTAERVAVLLQPPEEKLSPTAERRHVLQRRGEHLDLGFEELEEWRTRPRPVTSFHRETIHEAEFAQYPQDVQVYLKKLAQWKWRQRGGRQDVLGESVEVEIDDSEEETNPAAIPDPINLQLPIHMLIQRAVVERAPLDTTRENVGEDAEERNKASPVHLQQQASVPDLFEVLRVFVSCYPEGLVSRDAQGYTPLLLAMHVDDALPNLETVELLLGKRIAGYESLPAWSHDIPLHRMGRGSRYSNPAMVPCGESGQLPLHIAAEEMSTNFPLILSIHDSYPAAIHVQDGMGRTPLHIALHSYRRIPPDPRVVSLLFSDKVAQIRDRMGELPFDLLLDSGLSLPTKKPHDWIHSDADLQSYDDNDSKTIFQRFFNSSILGAAKPRTVTEGHNLLLRLQSLPPWLRKEACANTLIQELLIDELASPIMCASIILDGILLSVILTVFRIQITEFMDGIKNAESLSQVYTFAVYGLASLRIVLQVGFGQLSIQHGEFQHLCLTNAWFWVDLCAMLFSISATVLLYGSSNLDHIVWISTVATAFLWLAVLGYLSTWWYGMSVFTGIIRKVIGRMLFPLVGVAAASVAFAQMFYTLSQMDCSWATGVSSVCSVRDSYRVVYMLLRGESLVDPTGDVPMPSETAFLVFVFLFFFAFLLFGFFVALVLTALQLNLDEIALESYWEPKLAYFVSLSGLKCVGIGSISERTALVWDVLTSVLSGNLEDKEKWYKITKVHAAFLWPLALVWIPAWLLVGFFTIGILWPPQVRRLIFRPLGRHIPKPTNRKGFDQSNDEITQLKMMTFERTSDVEYELRRLRELLLIALKDE